MQVSRAPSPRRDRRRHGRGRRLRGRGALPPGAAREVGELLASGEARRSLKSLALTHARGQALAASWGSARAGSSRPSARASRRPSSPSGRARLATRTLCWQLPGRRAASRRRRGRRSSRARSCADYRFESLQVRARGRRDDADAPKHARAADRRPAPATIATAVARGGAGGRGGQPRARPAEPARQRPHADGARRVRAGARRRRSRGCTVEVRGPRRASRRAAWAPSPRSPRAPSRSPR